MQMQGTDLDEAKNSDTQLSGNGTFQEFSRLTESTAPSQNGKVYIIGDTDHNNSIGIKDATAIRKHLAKIIEFDPVTLTIADVDGSGSCTIKDATLIQKYIALIDAPSNVGNTVMLYE